MEEKEAPSKGGSPFRGHSKGWKCRSPRASPIQSNSIRATPSAFREYSRRKVRLEDLQGPLAEPPDNPVPCGVVKEHIAIYAGSFDPITNGHLDVLQRARGMFDRILLGIGHNPDKPSLFAIEEREEMAQELVSALDQGPDLAEVTVHAYKGLTVDFARSEDASALIRGIRNVTDLAGECQLAITNRQVADVETVFIVTGESYAFTSSGLIRQVAGLGGDIDRLRSIVPESVIERLRTMQTDPDSPLRRMARDGHVD